MILINITNTINTPFNWPIDKTACPVYMLDSGVLNLINRRNIMCALFLFCRRFFNSITFTTFALLFTVLLLVRILYCNTKIMLNPPNSTYDGSYIV